MSSIGSTTASQGLAGYLQNLSVSSSSTSTASTTATSTAATTTGTAGVNTSQQSLFQQLQSVVTTALQSAQSDPSADPNTTVENAIATYLKANNITPPAQGGVQGAHGHGGGHHGHRAGGAGGQDPDSDSSTSSTSSSSPNSAFFQTLKQAGIDPQQFHQDFLAAVKDAQSGTVDSSTALASVPNGTVVDTTA